MRGKKRSSERDKAKEIFIKSGGTIALKDIAAQLGVSEGTVRGWKFKDDWNGTLNGTLQKNQSERSEKKSSKSTRVKNKTTINAPECDAGNTALETQNNSVAKTNLTRKGGAPIGSKNAAGNKGGPPKNKKALKYGEFVSVFFTPDIIDETEKAIIEMDFDIYAHQLVLIDTLKIREKRILQEMRQIKDTPGGMLIESVTKEKGTTDFTYKKRDKDGKARDGDGSTEVIDKAAHVAVSEAERRLKLGEALTRVQGRLQKALEVWHKMQMDFERLEIDREKLELHRQRITGQIDLEELLDGDDFELGD